MRALTCDEVNRLPPGSMIQRGDVPFAHAEPLTRGPTGRWHLTMDGRLLGPGAELCHDGWLLLREGPDPTPRRRRARWKDL